jgi:ATP-dependent helicase HrpB
MNGATVIESHGRSHPVEIVHVGRAPETRIEEEMAAACRHALGAAEGSLLAFLPGVAEIERTAERLVGLPADVDLHRLTAASILPSSVPRSPRRDLAVASSCWPHRSPRPA